MSDDALHHIKGNKEKDQVGKTRVSKKKKKKKGLLVPSTARSVTNMNSNSVTTPATTSSCLPPDNEESRPKLEPLAETRLASMLVLPTRHISERLLVYVFSFLYLLGSR